MANAKKKPGNKHRGTDSADYRKRPGETDLAYRSRIAHLESMGGQQTGINPFAERQGQYVDAFIHHAESGTKVQTKLNRGGSTIDRWLNGNAFEQGEEKAIRHCQGLWAIIDGYSRSMEAIDGGEGRREHEALTELSGYKRKIPSKFWSVFENVARHHVDAERAGLGLANNNRSARDAAKVTTAFCAGMVATWNGY